MEYIPHSHLCEIVMTKKNWKQYCPYKGKFSEDLHECDECEHQVIVEFEDKEMLIIKNIIR